MRLSDVARSNTTKLDLPLDVHFPESRGSRVLEKTVGFTGQERDVLCAIFKKMLPLVINDKLSSISV